MKPEQLRVHKMLLDTIILLCKNSLPFSESLRIEGVIGITTDSSDVFLVHVNETLATETSSTIVNRETSHEPSFGGMAVPVKRSHTVSAAPVSQQNFIKIEDNLAPTKRDDFSFGRAVTKSFKNNASGFDMPVLQKTRATRTTYESEGSTAISSTVVTQSFMLGTNNDLQNEGVYYEEADQDEYGEQVDFKTEVEQEECNGALDLQPYRVNQQLHFMTTRPKYMRGARSKKAIRDRRARKVVRATQLVSKATSERNAMSSGSDSNQFIITKSTHVCGYPDCTKQFCYRKDLLRHQTRVHGREPGQRNTPTKGARFSMSNEKNGGDYSNERVNNSSCENHLFASGDSNEYVITKSTHVCGYPDCTKEFCYRRDLLRHQTRVHGREPGQRNTPTKGARVSMFTEEYGEGKMETDYSNGGLNDDSYAY